MSTTLRDLSGLADTPSSLAKSALVMVDLQNTYRRGTMQLVGVEPALEEARSLLERARSVGTPVFHIMHDAGAGSPYDLATELGQIADPVKPRENETVIVKKYPNSFVGTELDAKLKAAGIEDLILAGFMTHMCIDSTARGAFNLGYRATVVDAATATRDLPAADGSVLSAATLHAASLVALRDLFAVVVPHAKDIPA